MKKNEFWDNIIEAAGGEVSFWLEIEKMVNCSKCPAYDRCSVNDGIYCSNHLKSLYDECEED